MFNTAPDAGMEIVSDNTPVFENQYVDGTSPTPETPKAVFLKRTSQGLMRDDENGKEISSIFDILEPNDYVNHQLVTSVDDINRSITLQYFANTNVIDTEADIFSVLLHEEVEEWVSNIRNQNPVQWFENLDNQDSVNLFRALELVCLNVNMEFVKLFYITHSDKLNERLGALLASTLRKSIVDSQEDLNGREVISFSYDYQPEEIEAAKQDIEARNGKYLYHIAIVNTTNAKINDGDRVIVC